MRHLRGKNLSALTVSVALAFIFGPVALAQPVTEVWSQTYSGGGPSGAHGIAMYNGAVYAAGWTTTAGGDTDMFLLKYELDGTPVWQETWGGAAADTGGKIAPYDTHLYVAGDSMSYAYDPVGGVENDGITVKWTEDGDCDTTNSADCWWTRFSGWSGYYGNDNALNVVVDADGNLYTVGCSQINGSNTWTYVEKYDSPGVLQWQEHYGTSGYGPDCRGTGLTLSGGYVYASGHIDDGSGDRQLFVLKYTTAGTPVWTYTWGNGSTDEGGYGMVVSGNDIYVAGGVGSGGDPNGTDFLLVKLQDEGTSASFVDSATLATSGNDGATALKLVDGTIYVAGYTDVGGHTDSLLAVYDTDLNLLWDYSWGSTGDGDDKAFDLTVHEGVIYVAGMEDGYTTAYVSAFTTDCNENGIPDECDLDCGESGGPCDIEGCGGSNDDNSDAIPDECGACCFTGGCSQVPEMVCEAFGIYRGDGTNCEQGDCAGIPTITEWGMVVMTLLVLAAGTVVFTRRRMAQM